MRVLRVKNSEPNAWLSEVHYARRIPNVMHAFGLFDQDEPLGYVTYGSPSSAPLRGGIAGPENSGLILELNRLVFPTPIKNGPSQLVAGSIRMLPRPSIIVSYADTEQGHIGYVYQACNFIYTGLSAARTDWKIKGREDMHGQSVADISMRAAGSGRGGRAKYMRDKFGDDFYLQARPRKHRYIFIHAGTKDRKRLRAELRYPEQPYPKGTTSRYEIDAAPEFQPQLALSGDHHNH